ncbi:hypothetical protein KOR42_22610 [Thalassoglobus neptunius]|uniref:Uncharacterized protein n=2 Tax=Thalassoglobus neptunius TaxID=1938619 RepID=A0A5C5X7I7_9PLAN|nr:hypothetical protein KOR42_22610 [Thalassoglobus neptunius]
MGDLSTWVDRLCLIIAVVVVWKVIVKLMAPKPPKSPPVDVSQLPPDVQEQLRHHNHMIILNFIGVLLGLASLIFGAYVYFTF